MMLKVTTAIVENVLFNQIERDELYTTHEQIKANGIHDFISFRI